MAVDEFGGGGVGVAGEARYFLDGDAVVGHEADEGVAEFARCPGAVYPGGSDGGPEFAADVGGVELVSVAGGEHRPGGPALVVLELAEWVGGDAGTPRVRRDRGVFGVAVGAD